MLKPLRSINVAGLCFFGLLVCSLNGAAFADTISTTGDVAPILGEFRVDESGAATYSIDVPIPAGRAGVQPDITLHYSSRNKMEGLLGVGWSVSGTSAITRCPPTPIEDGSIAPITFTQDDKFCLDGQRLRLDTSTGVMGESGTSYHLDIDNFSIITAHGNAGEPGNPQYFSVKTKSGDTHYYGNAYGADPLYAGADAFVEPGGAVEGSKAKAWLLKAVQDIAGNYIVYHYLENTTTGLSVLDSIEYTGHKKGDAPFAKVEFVYETNEKGFAGYYFGTPIINNKRLTNIISTIDGRLYREMNLYYEATPNIEDRTLLASVEECAQESAFNSNKLCKRGTTFTWERPAVNTDPIDNQVCENETGIAEAMCWGSQISSKIYQPFGDVASVKTGFGNGGPSAYASRLFDVDGDGKDEHVFVSGGVWQVSSIDETQSFNGAVPFTSRGASQYSRQYSLVMDANADGVRDLLVADGKNKPWYRVSYINFQITEQLLGADITARGFEGETVVADVNGDAREDIVFREGDEIRAYLQPEPNGVWQERVLYTFPGSVESAFFDANFTNQTADMKTSSAFDMNGDGHTDIIIKVSTTKGMCQSGNIGGPPSPWWPPFQTQPSAIDVLNVPQTNDAALDEHEAAFRQSNSVPGALPQFNDRDACIANGGKWVNRTSSNYRVYITGDQSGGMDDPILNERETIDISGVKHLRTADFNGDGLSDIAYIVGDKWYYRLSTGIGFTDVDDMGFNANDIYNYLTQFIDLNTDGRADALVAGSTTSAQAYFSRPNMFGVFDAIFELRGGVFYGEHDNVVFGDVNGDSKLDALVLDGSNWDLHTKRSHINDFAITRFENGFGIGTDIEYRPMTDAEVYVEKPEYDMLPVNTITLGNAGFLVHEVHSDSNVGSQVGVRYEYGNLLVDTQGRGSLGFGLLRTTDLQTDIVTETTYYQDASGDNYAMVGMPLTTMQTFGSVVLSASSNTPSVLLTDSGGLFPYIQSSIENDYWVDTDATASTLASETVTSMSFDEYGNLLNSISTVTHYGLTNETLITETINAFDGSDEDKRLGRLSSATVIKTRDGVSTKRHSSFTYRSDNKMLESSTVHGDATTQNYLASDPRFVSDSLKTLYGYDDYGNKTRVCTTTDANAALPTNGLPTVDADMRCSVTQYYDNEGRFVEFVENGLGEQKRYEYWMSNGRLRGLLYEITEYDANNLAIETTFDGFGQGTEIDYFDDREVSINATFSDGEYGSLYQLHTEDNANADTRVYYDAWGREVARETDYRVENGLFDVVVVQTLYDNLGRVISVSEPNSTDVTFTVYDKLNRITSVTYPHGAIETVDYIGANIITTNAALQIRTEVKNGFNETEQVIDNIGNIIDYDYDAYGQLLSASTTFIADDSDQVITTAFDSWGRKVATNDPNQGNWTYQYNAFDELISQTDGNGHTYAFTVDTLGRVIKRYNAIEGTTCYGFGTPQSESNEEVRTVGKLRWSALYPSQNVTCTGTSVQPAITTFSERNEYTYDSLARLYTKDVTIDDETFTHRYYYDRYSRLRDKDTPYG
ncbi:toxin TcdB middle/N-terminal domain-containing protein, partial [Glaciecola siphonariae]